MLLMIEEGIREGICQVSHRHSKANIKYMKFFFLKKSTYIQMLIIYMDGQCHSHYL